jgi:hypothetical protein
MPGIQKDNPRPNAKEAKLAATAYTPGFHLGTSLRLNRDRYLANITASIITIIISNKTKNTKYAICPE